MTYMNRSDGVERRSLLMIIHENGVQQWTFIGQNGEIHAAKNSEGLGIIEIVLSADDIERVSDHSVLVSGLAGGKVSLVTSEQDTG